MDNYNSIITRAFKEQWTSLDLTAFDLKSFPMEVLDLTWLEKLSIRSNVIDSIPGEIDRLRALKVLDLSDNRILQIPPAVKNLKNLKSLNLSGNDVAVIPEWMFDMPSLKALDMSGNQVELFTCSFSNEDLESLRLEGNRIKNLPDNIGNLKAVHTLTLDGNLIESLPPGIELMQALRKIDLGGNQLSVEAMDIVAAIKNLRVLNMSGNFLPTIPSSIKKLEKLKALLLYGCHIEYIPAEIYEMDSLKVLDLSRNKIKVLSKSISNLLNLETLYISDNLIEEIPLEISTLPKLSSFLFFNNPLKPQSPFNQYSLAGVLQVYKQTQREKTLIGFIALSYELIFAFQKYLLGFENYLLETRSISINFNLKKVAGGLQIEVESPELDPNLEKIIAGSFNEYFSLIAPINLNKFEEKIDELVKENEFLKLELRSQVNNFKNDVDRALFKAKMLERENERLHLLLMESLSQKIILHSTANVFNQASNSQVLDIDVKIDLSEYRRAVETIQNVIAGRNINDLVLLDYLKDLQNSLDEKENSEQKTELEKDNKLKNRLMRFLGQAGKAIKQVISTGKDIKPFIESIEKLKELLKKIDPSLLQRLENFF